LVLSQRAVRFCRIISWLASGCLLPRFYTRRRFLEFVCLPQPARDASANVMREVAVFPFAESSLALLAVPHGLPPASEHFSTNPTVCPFFSFNQLFGGSWWSRCYRRCGHRRDLRYAASCSSVIEYPEYFDSRDCQTLSRVLGGVLPLITCCCVYLGQDAPLAPSMTTSKLPFSCWRTETDTSGEPFLFKTALRPLIILGAMLRFYTRAAIGRSWPDGPHPMCLRP
jgi:hypothetical protein